MTIQNFYTEYTFVSCLLKKFLYNTRIKVCILLNVIKTDVNRLSMNFITNFSTDCWYKNIFSKSANRTYPIVWNILKCRSRSNTAIRITYYRIINVSTWFAFKFFHSHSSPFRYNSLYIVNKFPLDFPAFHFFQIFSFLYVCIITYFSHKVNNSNYY